jgi:hypothetical protein
MGHNPGSMQPIQAQGAEEFQQANGPELLAEELRLLHKGRYELCSAPPLAWLEVQE